MLGTFFGDFVGSVFEHHPTKNVNFMPLYSIKNSFTDDTLCTVAVADSIVNNIEISIALRTWYKKYPALLYGGQFKKWLENENAPAYESYGNGAAMRISPVAFLSNNLEDALNLAANITNITHNHPESIKAAHAVTELIFLLLYENHSIQTLRKKITTTYGYDLSKTTNDIRPNYRFEPSCQKTVPQAIICALEAENFEHGIRLAVSLGGDADTLAAITGSILEARFGITADIKNTAIEKLPNDMIEVLKNAYTLHNEIRQSIKQAPPKQRPEMLP